MCTKGLEPHHRTAQATIDHTDFMDCKTGNHIIIITITTIERRSCQDCKGNRSKSERVALKDQWSLMLVFTTVSTPLKKNQDTIVKIYLEEYSEPKKVEKDRFDKHIPKELLREKSSSTRWFNEHDAKWTINTMARLWNSALGPGHIGTGQCFPEVSSREWMCDLPRLRRRPGQAAWMLRSVWYDHKHVHITACGAMLAGQVEFLSEHSNDTLEARTLAFFLCPIKPQSVLWCRGPTHSDWTFRVNLLGFGFVLLNWIEKTIGMMASK